ncbi:uncharacterized protein LOC116132053 [Pistacia vera]|uniref:uncharacterized protein LOC116132053 n=1 Tax=Pistacia vera TaxID=55513 RepID=UPI0012632C95|nr:uncharacterized protein LOC116132053 [Pistacia vera]
MAYVKAKDALLSELDEDDVDIAMVSSDPENTNDQKSNVVHGVRGKRNESKSKKKLTKVGRRKKRTPSRKKAKGALISISKVEGDGVTDNVDTEMVPSDPVMNGKESIILVSVHDENNLTDDVASGTATSNRHGIIDNIDTGIATSRQMKLRKAGKKKMALKMNSKESNAVPWIQDKVEHLKELEVGDRNFEKNTNKEVTNEVDSRNEAKNKEKPEGNSKNKVSELRKTGRKKMALRRTNEVVAKKRLNPESSNKTRMKDNTTGMIFMCSSKTKEDCFHYNVFGLPANKRDMVLKIYEGMRLFLFDYDLKMMYGIYKAAGPGGYNIEPKAFQSAFPSQVRFTVLEDCLPLAEEKFKKIIKDNYYSTNKFDCQLTFKQVFFFFSYGFSGLNSQGLPFICRCFSSKGSKSKRLHESSRAEAPTFVDHLSKRPRRSWKNERAETQEFFYHGHRHVWEERHPASSRDQLYSVDPVEYRRELYASPVAHPPLPHSMHQPLASELPPLETDFYRRDQLRYHCEQFLDVELRYRDEFEHHDSYRRFHHDEFEHRDSYRRFHHDEFEHHDSYRRFHHDEFEHHDSYRRSQRQVEFNHRDTSRRSQHQDEFKHRGNYRRSRHQDEFKHHDSYKRSREHQLDHHPSSSATKPPKYSSPASRRPVSKDHQTARLPADKRPGRSVLRSIVLK